MDRAELVARGIELQGVKASAHWTSPEWDAAEDALKPIREALGLSRWAHVTHAMSEPIPDPGGLAREVMMRSE